MKRVILAAVVPVFLSGCLPFPIAIATTSLGGLAFLTTGKSSTDHLISATFEKDCAVFRVVTSGEMCQEIGPNGEGRTIAVVETSYPGEGQDWVPDPMEEAFYGELSADQQEELRKSKEAQEKFDPLPYPKILKTVETELASSLAPFPRKVDVDAVVEQVGTTNPVTSAAGWDFQQEVTLVSMSWDNPEDQAAEIKDQSLVKIPEATELKLTAVSAPVTMAAVNPETISSRLDRGEREAAARDENRFLVVGSFRQPWRAHKLAARFVDNNAKIYKVNVKNDIWRRVVIGPLSPGEAVAMKQKLAKVDGKKPWITSGLKTELLASVN